MATLQEIADKLGYKPTAIDQQITGRSLEEISERLAITSASGRIQELNELRDSIGQSRLSTNETEAIVNAHRILFGRQPIKTISQIEFEQHQRTRESRGVLGNLSAGAFSAVTSIYPELTGIFDPETGRQLRIGQQLISNLQPGIATTAGEIVGGVGKFAFAGPVAIAEAGLGAIGRERITAAEARIKGLPVSGAEEALSATASGVIDTVLTALLFKVGSKAANSVRAAILPSVRNALAQEGLVTAKQIAIAGVTDALKVGGINVAQYVANTGMGHITDPEIRTHLKDAIQAGVTGALLPVAMGVLSTLRSIGHPPPPTLREIIERAKATREIADANRANELWRQQNQEAKGLLNKTRQQILDLHKKTGVPISQRQMELGEQLELPYPYGTLPGEKLPVLGGQLELAFPTREPTFAKPMMQELLFPEYQLGLPGEAVLAERGPLLERGGQMRLPLGIAAERGLGPATELQQITEGPKPPPDRPPTLVIPRKPDAPNSFLSDETGGIEPQVFLTAVGATDLTNAAGRIGATITSAAADIQRTFASTTRGKEAALTAASMRAENSKAARAMDISRKALEQSRYFFDAYQKEKGVSANIDFMDRIDQGKPQVDTILQPIANTLDNLLKTTRDEVRALGTGALEKFHEDYFPRAWTNETQAQQWYQMRSRQLTGPKAFLKQRQLPSMAEGIEAGLMPVTTNPIEMALMKVMEMRRYIAGVNVIHTLEKNGIAIKVKVGEQVPTGYQRIHEKIGLHKAKNPVTGELEPGVYYAPEQVATLINNQLSPGLQGKQWFRTYLGSANWLNQIQLGLSGFHLFFTSADATISKVALGIKRGISYRDIGGAVKDILSAPLAPITNIIRGHKGLMEWYKPGTQGDEIGAIMDVIEAAGGRAKMDRIYRTHVSDRMMEAWRQGNIAGALFRLPWAAFEIPSRFIMETVVPRQKMGVAMDLIRMEMQNNPGISKEALVAKGRQIWNSADNRMGQLVYDNLFWNKLTRDMALASIRSVGWNLGTFREILGGTHDILKQPFNLLRGKSLELTYRSTYVVALPMVHMAVGGILNYIFTGEPPKDLVDYFFPRTGGLDENGRPKRVSLPTYCRDIYHYAIEPLKTLSHKIHPALQAVYEMLTNKDFYGTRIRNEDDPLVQQAFQVGRYMLSLPTPLSVRNYTRSRELGESHEKAAIAFVGVTPAPAAITQTRAERIASEMLGERMPAGAKTPEQQQELLLKRRLRRDIVSGDLSSVRAAISAGQITRQEGITLVKQSKQAPLQRQIMRLEAPQAVRIWDNATEEERKLIKIYMILKLQNYVKTHTTDEINQLVIAYRQRGIIGAPK